MSVVKMQKLSICANKKHRKEILELMQSMGIMEIITQTPDDYELEKMDTHAARTKYERRAQSYDQVLALIGKYSSDLSSGGLFSQLSKVTRKEIDELTGDRHSYNVKVEEALGAEKKISECMGIIQKDENLKMALTPWLKLDIPLSYKGTKTVRALIGTLPREVTEADLYALASEDIKEPAAISCSLISAQRDMSCVAVLCRISEAEQVEKNLRKAGFSKTSLAVLGVPGQEYEELEEEIIEQKKLIEEQKESIALLSTDAQKFRILGDYYRNRAGKYKTLGGISQSRNVFFIEGWVPAENAEDLAVLLGEKFEALVQKEDIKEEDIQPTLLKNNAFSRNVEGILKSYDVPRQGKVDPTFIMSIFYVIFFGMMLSDAGYGIIMFAACAVVLKKFPDMAEDMKKSIKLFFWCGLSTTFWGFMYGGFFGDAIDVIAKTFMGYSGETPILKPLWFMPLYEPMRLLMWCLLFGLIHMFIGLGIKGYECLKDGDMVGFISDILAWYLFLLGLIFMLLPTDLFRSISGIDFSAFSSFTPAAKGMAILGALTILFMSGRSNKNWGLRIALGAYDLYNITGWLSDTLSYSRLLALGLATGVIANVVNMMASMGGATPFGVIMFIIVFILGHTLNIAINALGAYVHTNRLQYVEFFGKFYDAGGKPFSPFKTANKYIQIKEEK